MEKKTSRKTVRFLPGEDEKLIEFVRGNRILYDLKHPEFKNSTKRDRIWEEAGKFINRTAAECRTRWKSVRDHHRRYRNTTGLKQKRAVYWQWLTFLDESETDVSANVSIKNEQDTSNLVQSDLVISEEEQSFSASPVQSFKRTHLSEYRLGRSKKKISNDASFKVKRLERNRRRRFLHGAIPQIENETELFFKTLSATVKKFRPDLATRTKAKIFEIVTEMELQNQLVPETSAFVNVE